jgi:hypothetical protein
LRRRTHRFQRALEQGFDHRRFAPALIQEGQPDFFDQCALPVMVGDFSERCQAQTVRQAQVVQSAGVVVQPGVQLARAAVPEQVIHDQRGALAAAAVFP